MASGRVFSIKSLAVFGLLIFMFALLMNSVNARPINPDDFLEWHIGPSAGGISSDDCTDYCVDTRCNIGDPYCNSNAPLKKYNVPTGGSCTFTGTIKNTGCIAEVPAVLSVIGNGCSQNIQYSDCSTKEFQFTCNQGAVSFSSNDPSYFTLDNPVCGGGLTKECVDEEGVEHENCLEERCNIGHDSCLTNLPSKDYVVPAGQRCTFIGTIKNSGCAWKNPATLTVTGNGCNREFSYSPLGNECSTKEWTVTCNPGNVHFKADDSSYFNYGPPVCEPISGQCGDGTIDQGEECERPQTNNNQYCPQSTETCRNNKLGTRDNRGRCDSVCDCRADDFTNFKCVEGKCNAECDSNDDCDDGLPQTTDTCNNGCACEHEYNPTCGNGVLNPNEQCEPAGELNHQSCTQTTETCEGYRYGERDGLGNCNSGCFCSNDPFSTSCIKGRCNAECDSDDDCNDNNIATLDTCTYGCVCENDYQIFCGNGIVEAGENCEQNTDCFTNQQCVGCDCVAKTFCGDNDMDPGEECDAGTENGIPCFPGNGFGCTYCDEDCELVKVPPGSCGDGNINYGEECDLGSLNGQACAPGCEASCNYCTSSCTINWITGPECTTPTPTPIPIPIPVPVPVPYPTPGPVIITNCGDGVIGLGEECDFGNSNGVICSPGCGSTCTYCSESCDLV